MKRKIACYFPCLIITVLGLAGCELINPGDTDDKLSPSELKALLIEKNWELRTVLENGYGTYAPEMDSMYTLRFMEDGTFTGHEICNQCGGNYTIDDNSNLVFEEIACTEIACSGFQHSIPFTASFVNEALPATIKDGQLFITLAGDSAQTTYLFAEYGTKKEVIMARPASTEEFDFSAWPNSNHHHIEASVSGDSIHVEVGYSGCDVHELNLVAYNYFSGTEPAQARAFVSHTAEACRAALGSSETFSLVPVKEAYQETIGSSGSIQLIIGENGLETDTVLYFF